MRYIIYTLLIMNIINLNSNLYAQDSTSCDTCSNFFLISGIKSISGTIPDHEFFDLHAKFQFGRDVFALASFDIALTNVGSDSANSKSEKLTEASVFISYVITELDKRKRAFFAGGLIKIFDTVPYYGLHIGSIENRGSLFTSYFVLGLMHRFYSLKNEDTLDKSTKEHNSNIYVEFSLYSKDAPFVNNLRIKGGVMLPTPFLNDDSDPTLEDIKTRIVLEIPIGDVFKF